MLAQVQIRDGKAQQAITVLEALRKKQPQLVQAQLLLADAFRMNNRVSDALAIYNALEKHFPTNAQLPLLRGSTLLQVPDTVAAREAFQRALELLPDLPVAVEQLVNLDLAEKHFDAAMQRVNTEVQKFPKDAQWRMMTARYPAGGRQAGRGRVRRFAGHPTGTGKSGRHFVPGTTLRRCRATGPGAGEGQRRAGQGAAEHFGADVARPAAQRRQGLRRRGGGV